MFDELALIIKTLEDHKDALAGKFLKAKRLALLADLLGPAFHPPVKKKSSKAEVEENPKVKEFYHILHEFDRKFEFTGIAQDRFTKIYGTYMKKLKEIYHELVTGKTVPDRSPENVGKIL